MAIKFAKNSNTKKILQSNCFFLFFILFHWISFLVPIWSGITISGVRLRDVNTQLGNVHDPEDWKELHRQAIDR